MYNPFPKIIVIGGNAAGPAAAAKAKRVNPDAEVILFESGNFISTGTCELPYLISGEIDDYNKIVHFTPETFLESKNVQVYNNHEVISIDEKRKEISVKNKLKNEIKVFPFDNLILTTGSSPREIPELPFAIENVKPLKSVHDYLRVKEYFDSNEIKKVLVIGSGYIGLETAEALVNAGHEVTILEQADRPIPQADKEVSSLIQDTIVKNNIVFLSSATDVEYIISDSKFTGIKYNGVTYNFDFALVAIGVVPNTTLAESIGLRLGEHKGLLVDSKLKTSNYNIYAAGDNIELVNKITNRKDYFPLATYAHQYGHIAGENAAGGNTTAKPVILNSAFKFFDLAIAQVGLTEEKAKENFVNARSVSKVAYSIIKVMPNARKVFGKIIYDERSKQIYGASFVGGQEVTGYADLISNMIFNKLPITNLSEMNYNYTPPLSPFVNILSLLARKI